MLQVNEGLSTSISDAGNLVWNVSGPSGSGVNGNRGESFKHYRSLPEVFCFVLFYYFILFQFIFCFVLFYFVFESLLVHINVR